MKAVITLQKGSRLPLIRLYPENETEASLLDIPHDAQIAHSVVSRCSGDGVAVECLTLDVRKSDGIRGTTTFVKLEGTQG